MDKGMECSIHKAGANIDFFTGYGSHLAYASGGMDYAESSRREIFITHLAEMPSNRKPF
jgi:hypothetical protein